MSLLQWLMKSLTPMRSPAYSVQRAFLPRGTPECILSSATWWGYTEKKSTGLATSVITEVTKWTYSFSITRNTSILKELLTVKLWRRPRGTALKLHAILRTGGVQGPTGPPCRTLRNFMPYLTLYTYENVWYITTDLFPLLTVCLHALHRVYYMCIICVLWIW